MLVAYSWLLNAEGLAVGGERLVGCGGAGVIDDAHGLGTSMPRD